MPIFAAALAVARRRRGSPQIMIVPVEVPPVWRSMVDEIREGLRRLGARWTRLSSRRDSNGW